MVKEVVQQIFWSMLLNATVQDRGSLSSVTSLEASPKATQPTLKQAAQPCSWPYSAFQSTPVGSADIINLTNKPHRQPLPSKALSHSSMSEPSANPRDVHIALDANNATQIWVLAARLKGLGDLPQDCSIRFVGHQYCVKSSLCTQSRTSRKVTWSLKGSGNERRHGVLALNRNKDLDFEAVWAQHTYSMRWIILSLAASQVAGFIFDTIEKRTRHSSYEVHQGIDMFVKQDSMIGEVWTSQSESTPAESSRHATNSFTAKSEHVGNGDFLRATAHVSKEARLATPIRIPFLFVVHFDLS
ncbi:uncharacterized protein BDR25DRAFT_361585 [Lindgomyces ingoldianus]|uniref:Uncharacterized protein n=1 Tax=Lindgomyces ingoldianus TaxID=673940 RepID=A0ACB6QC69_9PLEO|nr:uncharacterized protein BDR25DRAFT_361585 [Lindgomyces ingoldianus]KAF2464507.1 hypothetical protein BDR25DRAFT_361585 [Lindgomyces ingoldianus]